MRVVRPVAAAVALSFVALSSCNETPTAPIRGIAAVDAPLANLATTIVISEFRVRGPSGGNDEFVELHNPTTLPIDISGWKLKGSNNAGTTSTRATVPASVTVPPGGFYLLTNSASGGYSGAVPGNTTYATGITDDGGLAITTAGDVIQDAVGLSAGSAFKEGTPLASLGSSNLNRGYSRKAAGGCPAQDTGDNSADFLVLTPSDPQNAASTPCVAPTATVVTVVVTPASATVTQGNTQLFTGTAYDASNNPIPNVSFTWTKSNNNASLVPTTGATSTATGVTPGDVTITATSSNNVSGSATLHIDPAPIVSVTVTPTSASIETGDSQTFTAVAKDAGNNVVSTTFTWTSSASAVASVSPTGVATALGAGSSTITAKAPNGVEGSASLSVTDPTPPADVVISQVYGGGGNSGAVYTNDFIELHNRTDQPVSLAGWSVQRTGTTGPTSGGNWDMTPLSGTIQPYGYFLIQESAGAGGTTPLPTPDATGTATLGATNGKVILASTVTAFSTPCPTSPRIADRVGYGTESDPNGCGASWGRTATLSNTTAAFRLNDCIDTGNGATDFYVQAPAPRNSATPAHSCAASTAAIVINEILAEPLNAVGGSSWGEWFEVKNTGATPVDLQGWTITSQGQPKHVVSSSVVVPPGGIKVLGRGSDPALNGGITIDYNYFTGGLSTIFLDNSDVLLLNDAGGALVDVVRWAGGTFAPGYTKGVKDASADNFDAGSANWGYATATFGDGDFGTPGFDNGTLSDVKPIVPTLSFSGRVPTDPPLPVGFEAQIFATEGDGSGGVLITTITWTALNPDIATIDERGVIRSVASGFATFRATATDGATATYTLPMAVATASTTAHYGNNTEFGDPVDGDPSNDFIVRRAEYTTSYNNAKGTPNWVSYDLDGSHIGAAVDRCNCFTFDPLLPSSFTHLNTADYTGAGSFAGYGIDRGHMTRSFDRTSGTLDNANTYLLSNVIPQAADLNQGPWAQMETFLGDLARFSNKEVYVITGPAGNKGTVKNEGKIVIPTQVWKVALVMPRDQGLADVHHYTDVEVYAVIAPNDPGVRNVDWHTWLTTVDAVEALSGYDLLSLLPDNIETTLESGIKPPVAAVNGPFVLAEGGNVALSGAGSFDPNGAVVSYAWNFGDGGTGNGVGVSHTYAQDGNYTVTLTVTDNDGLTDIVTTTASVGNVAPSIGAFPSAILPAGTLYSATNSFTDPGDDTWSATVDYGDGSGVQPLVLTGKTFALSHVYATGGNFTLTVRIADDDAVSTRTANITSLFYPVANAGGPYAASEGTGVLLNGASSSDADGSIANYVWDFGDGNTASGPSVSHTYAQDGSYPVTLTVTDNDGLTSVASATVTVANVAPSVSALAGATLLPHETWSASGTFFDPGADVCTATVDYGDGSGVQTISLGAGTFALSHTYNVAGSYTVTLSISDDDAATTQTATIVVSTQAAAIQNIVASIDQLLANGAISSGNANSLKAKLNAARARMLAGQSAAAVSQLNALLNEIDAMLRSGRLSPSDAEVLRASITRVIGSL